MPPIPFFMNSRAGALKHTPTAEDVIARMDEIGLSVEHIPTTSPEDMCKKLTEQLEKGVEKIIVAGGDGTIRFAAQQLAHTNCALGIIPMGTANNFANALRLPMDLTEALRVVKDGMIKEVSMGKINDRYFTEAAGVGLFADALSIYGKGTNKNIFKGLYSMIRLLFALPRTRIKVTIDDRVIVERVAMCTVANIARMGRSYSMAPDALLTDDVLDVVILGDIRRREIPQYLKALKEQVHENLPKFQIQKGKVITIESLHSLNVHCDDTVVTSTPVTISLDPKALKVIIPRL